MSEDPERMTFDHKQKVKKIHVNEPDQSNCQLSSTTLTDETTKESKKMLSNVKAEQINNYYFCQQRNYRYASSQDLAAMSKDNNLQQEWLFHPKHAYCEKTKT